MSGRKRRDRPLTMDELLRRSQAGTSGDPRPTAGVAHPSSTATGGSPSTSHLVLAPTPAAPPRLASDDPQTGISLFN